jgi:hypothetical protein
MSKPLFILSADDDPHRAHPHRPTIAVCGIPLKGSIVITEAQALIWLDDRRCLHCFPHHRHPHAYRYSQMGRRAERRLASVRQPTPEDAEQPDSSVRNSVLRWAAA